MVDVAYCLPLQPKSLTSSSSTKIPDPILLIVSKFCSTGYHDLADAHCAAWSKLIQATSTQVLHGNLIGSFYYIVSVALIIPLRLTGEHRLSAGEAGFVGEWRRWFVGEWRRWIVE